MKFGFYVSRTATRLCKLLCDSRSNDKIAFVLIDCTSNDELRNLCLNRGIPLYEYSYKELGLKGKEQNEFISNKFMQLMDEYGVTYSFICGSRILQGKLLEKYKWHLINFHPAVLPAHKGKYAIDQALDDGSLLTGNTAYFIDENLDAGITIMQNLFPVYHFQNYDDVLDKQLPMMLQIMKWLEEDRVIIEGNRCIIRDATYTIGEYIPSLEIRTKNNLQIIGTGT